MTLATIDDAEARAGRNLTNDEIGRLVPVLDDVAASVRVYTGQDLRRVPDRRLRARVKRGWVRLPQRPVHDVASVTDRFGTPVTFEWDGLDRVYVECHRTGLAPVQVIDVVYDAGPDAAPPALVGLVCAVALRSLGVDPLDGGKIREEIDGYSYALGSAGGAGAYGLLPGEKETLDRFRRPAVGTIRVAR
jgi:YD repeat-containing protein